MRKAGRGRGNPHGPPPCGYSKPPEGATGIVESKKKKICDKNPSEDTFVCPPAESFVCGSDGKTYKNICLLGKAMRASCGKIRYEHLGQCVVQKTS
ncbi:serine protease inhibitor Kazal-type 12-like [Hemicordylus capensis]|uniref:serine protease inhibitor Kazal-type 12-like n=1 Tax=Hemicordylus capensis TaxID=884348 RepID=UPI002302F92F|nr:serine protease inhibitor Kazal-type 12-like [Hemicordylus capensis]